METFRYPQFCPVARAAEVLGHRWVLPLLRDLHMGPQRFGDLRRRMGGGVSTSVLSKRLAALEQQGVVAQRTLPPPAASVVYELTARGRELEPVLLEIIRWGALMMSSPTTDEHFEPEWLRLAAEGFARSTPTPDLVFEFLATGEGPAATVRGHGGADGTSVDAREDFRVAVSSDEEVDLRVEGPAVVLLGFISGKCSPATLRAHPEVRIEGDVERIEEVPALFEVPSESISEATQSKGEVTWRDS